MKVSSVCACIICSIIVYESYLGEHHNHLPEQNHEVPQNQIAPLYTISSGTTLYNPEKMDWYLMDNDPNLYRRPDLTYLFTPSNTPILEKEVTNQFI